MDDARYWRSAAQDEAMQDEHGFIWIAMLEMVGPLDRAKVLDVGCNRGGFLRLLADQAGIARGYGYDPASAAVEDARRLSGDRPLAFEASTTVPETWTEFDAAFSHEVLYLLHDLSTHARAVREALKPRCSYFATMGVHRGSQLMRTWHAEHRDDLQLPELRSLDEVAEIFENEGFDVAVGRLPIRFVPIQAHRDDREGEEALEAWLDYYLRDKVMFRFTRPEELR